MKNIMIDISIIQTVETLFFGHMDGVLRQWIYVTIENASAEATTAVTVIRAGGEPVSTILELAPGTHEYRVYAPVLWPEHPPEQAAALWLQVRDKTIEAGVPVGHHRPWTVYLLADVCTDCTWVYADFEAMTKDDADLTRVELNLAEAARDGPPGNSPRSTSIISCWKGMYRPNIPCSTCRLPICCGKPVTRST